MNKFIAMFVGVFLITGGVAYAGQTNCTDKVDSIEDVRACISDVLSTPHEIEVPIAYVAYTESDCSYMLLRPYGEEESYTLAILGKKAHEPVYQGTEVYGRLGHFQTTFEPGNDKVRIHGESLKISFRETGLSKESALDAYINACRI